MSRISLGLALALLLLATSAAMLVGFRDVTAGRRRYRDDAGTRRLTVEMHGAASAQCLAAGVFRPRESGNVPNRPK